MSLAVGPSSPHPEFAGGQGASSGGGTGPGAVGSGPTGYPVPYWIFSVRDLAALLAALGR